MTLPAHHHVFDATAPALTGSHAPRAIAEPAQAAVARAGFALGLACLFASAVAMGQDMTGVHAQPEPYVGPLSARVITPGESRDPDVTSGSGSAQFVPIKGGGTRLVVKGSLKRDDDTGFVIEGDANGAGWRGRSRALSIEIDGRGNISGGGVENSHRITFTGRASARQIELVVETEKLSDSGATSLPTGTRIVFDYRLARADTSFQAGSADAASRKTCKRRVWKTRNVTTPGGGMTMTQVPHCLD